VLSKLARLLTVATAAMCIVAIPAIPQQKGKDAKKSYVLTGKVEGVNESGKTMTVNHADVPGYMSAMTMPYKVDQADAFKKVKVGDQIKAKVYDGDYTLYEIEVVPSSGAKKK
jgi:Cu/Ag efflux protein CusF